MSSPSKESTDAPRHSAAESIQSGATSLGIELGSTRIKAVLIGREHEVLAQGSYEWENRYVDQLWTYPLDEVWSGIQAAVSALRADAVARSGVPLLQIGALGVSAMMHGYLAFDENDELLVPFRTWRNTNTGPAAAELSRLIDFNVPLRWSVAHLYQAVLDQEPHVPQVRFVTTLAGYVHWRLTGRRVLGVGDASGMFPIDPQTGDYDRVRLAKADRLFASRGVERGIRDLFPAPLTAGADAGTLTAEGAALLDPSGEVQPGSPLAPPEGDAGTGMVATHSVAPRTGNTSVGTSIFAMVVLESALETVHPELDIVTTPTGSAVAMVHCNNGASELGAWAGLFGEFADALGVEAPSDAVFGALLHSAVRGEPDAGGLVSYNYLSGEPIAGLDEGRPLYARTPESELSLANFMRSQLNGVFATLSIGMRTLTAEGVGIDTMYAHGGLFKTAGVAQRVLAAAIETPVAVGTTAGEGGAWGMAVLASYRLSGAGTSLDAYLSDIVFAGADETVVAPDPKDVAGYRRYLDRFVSGLAVERAAVETFG